MQGLDRYGTLGVFEYVLDCREMAIVIGGLPCSPTITCTDPSLGEAS